MQERKYIVTRNSERPALGTVFYQKKKMRTFPFGFLVLLKNIFNRLIMKLTVISLQLTRKTTGQASYKSWNRRSHALLKVATWQTSGERPQL